jgi:hypothetical protein
MLRYLLLRCNLMHNLPAGVSCIATPKICTEHIVCCRTVSLLEPAIQVIQSNSSPKEKVSTTAEICLNQSAGSKNAFKLTISTRRKFPFISFHSGPTNSWLCLIASIPFSRSPTALMSLEPDFTSNFS